MTTTVSAVLRRMYAVVASAAAFATLAVANEVRPVELDALVRWSDVVAVGKVERVVEVENVTAERNATSGEPRSRTRVRVAEASVSRLLKGVTASSRIAYLVEPAPDGAATTEESGETVLLFLHRGGESLRSRREGFAAAIDDAEFLFLAWSGCARLPIRVDDGHELVTLHTAIGVDARLVSRVTPAGDGTNSRRVELDAAVSAIGAIVRDQASTWFSASARSGVASEVGWDLEVAVDRTAKLLVHRAGTVVETRFLLPATIAQAIDAKRNPVVPEREVLGAPPPSEDVTVGEEFRDTIVRTMRFADGPAPRRWTIHSISDALIEHGVPARVREALELWWYVRAAIEDPGLIDGRDEDDRMLGRRR